MKEWNYLKMKTECFSLIKFVFIKALSILSKFYGASTVVLQFGPFYNKESEPQCQFPLSLSVIYCPIGYLVYPVLKSQHWSHFWFNNRLIGVTLVYC